MINVDLIDRRVRWPAHVRGDVIELWRSELNLKRKEVSVLLGVSVITLRPSCSKCNFSKSNKLLSEWNR
jgi:hypothetical protein